MFGLCVVPSFAQSKLIIKGLKQAGQISSFTERTLYLKRLNPTITWSTIKEISMNPAAYVTQAEPTAVTHTDLTSAVEAQTRQTLMAPSAISVSPLPKAQRFIQLPQRPRTGIEVWNHFGLRNQLQSTALFSEGELDQVEQAFKNADEIFYRDDFSLITDGWENAEEPWDYMDQLGVELRNTMQLSDKQWKAIEGVKRGPNMGLRPYGQLLSLQNYVLYTGEMPPRTPIHPLYAIIQSRKTARKTDGVSMEMYGIYEDYKTNKTPEEWLAEYEAHPEQLVKATSMYKAFQQKNMDVKEMIKAGKEKEIPTSWQVMSTIYLENTTRVADPKTPQEWLAEYEAHPEQLTYGTPLYKAFKHKNEYVKEMLANGKTEDEIPEGWKVMSDIFLENTKRIADPKTPQEWLAEYEAHPEQLTYGTAMYQAFRQRNFFVKSMTEDGKGNEIPESWKKMSAIFLENTTRHADPKTPQEWLAAYEQYTKHAKSDDPKFESRGMYEAFRSKAREVEELRAANTPETEIPPSWKNIHTIYRKLYPRP